VIAATQLWWDTARAGGIVSWCLLAASVLWGLAISTKATTGRIRPNWMLDLHRFLGGLATIFVGVHVAGLVLDSYVSFGLTEVLVPFASSWHPLAVAWGIVGMYLLAAVELTSLARRKLSRRLWRGVHALAFPTFALATVHGLSAGTDRTNMVWQVTVWTTVAAVVVLTAIRVLELVNRRSPPPRTARGRPAEAPTASAPAAPWTPPVRPPAGPPLRLPHG
jgi:predicted ferric reductase